MKTINLDELGTALGEALDEDGFEKLVRDHRRIAEGVMEAVKGGMGETQVYNFVLHHTNSPEMARWCQQAARHLQAQIGS